MLKPPTVPFWFRQRQGKAEPAGPETYRLAAPNLGEAFIGIRQAQNGRWLPTLKQTADGPDLLAAAHEFATPQEAWEAAFEAYRVHFIV